jgi:hypothetical protein
VETVADAADREAASDALTRESEAAIRNAPGATATVSAEVKAAGLAALCRRTSHKDSPRCKS